MSFHPNDELMVDLDFVWEQSIIDPTQYKPLMPTLKPIGIIVRVQIPEKFVELEESEDITIISPEGLAYASKQIAIAIKKSYEEK